MLISIKFFSNTPTPPGKDYVEKETSFCIAPFPFKILDNLPVLI